MEDMDGYTGGCVGGMGKAMTEMVIVFFYAVMGGYSCMSSPSKKSS